MTRRTDGRTFAAATEMSSYKRRQAMISREGIMKSWLAFGAHLLFQHRITARRGGDRFTLNPA